MNESSCYRQKVCAPRTTQHLAPSLALPLSLARFCHQLDFSTSGALCVALNKAAAASAYKCFKERRVTKAYLALVRTASWLGGPQPARMPNGPPPIMGEAGSTSCAPAL